MQANPQYLRTDKAIRQALIKLLKSKPFEKITVQDILDETPVTRSTFYKHYHDKYEIAERMQDEFFESQEALQKAFHDRHSFFTPEVLRISQQNHELMDALLKIHTENVDIRRSLSHHAYHYYLSGTAGASPELEADIFAQALTAFRLSNKQVEEITFDFLYDTFISVFLRILGLSEDEELYKTLKKKALSMPKDI